MEKLNIAHHKQLGRHLTSLGMACAIGLSAPQFAPSATAQESLVQKELARRIDNARKANELLHQGDAAYNQQDYKSAVADYAQAFSLLPGGAMSHEMRAAAADRYATAATARGRQLAKSGDYDKAKQLLDQVLKPEIAPTHLGALKLRGQINDPIRYNHAITLEHVKDVQKVGISLREAEGFYNLGQYDRALMVYQDILRIDPFNKAARRGMEKIEATKSDYYRAAYDHTRAQMLGSVDQAWEMPVNPEAVLPVVPEFAEDLKVGISLREKLEGINVEVIDLENTSLEEALDFVRVQSRLGDAPSVTGEKSGVNIVLNLGDSELESSKVITAARVDLKARDLPLSKILDYITDQTHTQWRSDGAAIIVTPLGSSEETLVNRTFQVPPNFLSSTTSQQSEDSGSLFDDAPSNAGGIIPKKMSITEFLQNNGINFPEGASASYTPGNNSLRIRNTTANIDIVDQLVSALANEEPVQVVIRTTIMRVSEKKLKALNFDWLISPAHLGSGLHIGGGTVGNGTPLLDMPLSPFSGLGNPITSGTRSGDTGLHADSIDSFINAGSTGFGSTELRAPGILTVTGVYSGVQVQMMMRGLDQQTGADVLQKPSTIARSGERSKIEVIREFIYPTEYEPPELPNSVGGGDNFNDPLGGQQGNTVQSTPVTPAHPTAFETRNVGVTLEVEPTVGPNKQFIELSLRPELVEFQGFVNYGTPITGMSGSSVLTNLANIGTPGVFTTNPGQRGIVTENEILMPIFKTTRLKDQSVTIQDGATIVLGGVMSSRKTKIEDKVPLLGDIPYAGRLFRSEADQTVNEAVVIMVQAELIDPAGVPWKGR